MYFTCLFLRIRLRRDAKYQNHKPNFSLKGNQCKPLFEKLSTIVVCQLYCLSQIHSDTVKSDKKKLSVTEWYLLELIIQVVPSFVNT